MFSSSAHVRMSLLQQQKAMMENNRLPYQRLGLYLTMLASLLNKLPLLVLRESRDCFTTANAVYENFAQVFANTQSALMRQAIDETQWRYFVGVSEAFLQQEQKIKNHLILILQNISSQDTLLHTINCKLQRIIDLNENDEVALEEKTEISTDQVSLGQQKQEAQKTLNQLIERIKALETFFAKENKVVCQRQLRSVFPEEKQQAALEQSQQQVKRWQSACHAFAALTQTPAEIESQRPSLEETDYRYLAFLSLIFTFDGLCQLLQHHENCWRRRFLSHQEKSQFLHRLLRVNYSESLRHQRIIIQLETWLKIMQDQSPVPAQAPSSFNALVALEEMQILKKPFYFNQGLLALGAETVISRLHQDYQAKDIPPDKFYVYLKTTHVNLRQQISILEGSRLQPYPFWQRGAAQLIASSQTLGGYQIGRFSAATISEMMSHTNVPVLRETLPPWLEERLQWGTGLSFLGVDALVASWVGSSYQLLMLLNRIVLSYSECWQQVGDCLEVPTQNLSLPLLAALKSYLPEKAHPLLMQLGDYLRTDEIGLAEKQIYINWLFGLLFQVGFSVALQGSRYMLPTTAGYGLATLAASLTQKAVQELTGRFDMTPAAREGLQLMSQVVSYAAGYRLGFGLGAAFIGPAPPVPAMTETEALNVLDLPKGSDENTVHTRYRTLSKLFHPDKCSEYHCAQKMTDINLAYESLTKKLK